MIMIDPQSGPQLIYVDDATEHVVYLTHTASADQLQLDARTVMIVRAMIQLAIVNLNRATS